MSAAPTPARVAPCFDVPGTVRTVVPFGDGHVNLTTLATTNTGARFVLQRLNRASVAHPERAMANIVALTRHLAAKVGDPRRSLRLIPTREGAWWHTDETGEVWRAYAFVEGSASPPSPLTPAAFRAVGRAFGEFLVQVDDLDPAGLHTTIPHFHDEPRYVARLRAVIAADPLGRAGQVRPEIEAALAYEAISHDFDDPDLMPTRVTHNDAKVANLLVDEITGEPLCVVDLDTVQAGYAVNDFGDAIRSGATSAPEDEPDTARVRFVPELFAAFTQGYLGACGEVLTPAEIAHLRHGARAMTLETSLRFLTDYIEGDVFYRVERPGHNLDRARNQLALLADLSAHWDWMGHVIDEVAGTRP